MRSSMIGWYSNNHENEKLRAEGTEVFLGILLAVLSAVATGSFTIFSKTNKVKEANVEPLIFNFWTCVGVVLSSAIVGLNRLVKSHLLWSPWGLLSGLFFVLSAANSFRSVRLIGVSVGTGIWSGTAVLVSFAAGLLLDPEDGVDSLIWAVISVAVILVGIVGITYAGHFGRKTSGEEEDLSALLSSEGSDGGNNIGTFAAGVIAALLAGLLGGLIMIPLIWADEEFQGVNYLPSFGVGVLIFAPIFTCAPYFTSVPRGPNLAPTAAAWPGIVSGVVWNIGNLFSIVAIGYVSYSVVYPIIQCGILVAGIWGMILFDEISGNVAASFYWISGLVIIVGVSILAWAGN